MSDAEIKCAAHNGRALAFTLAAVAMLALGICANGTVFSWINATMLHPIPGAARTGELVSLMRGARNESPSPPFSYPDYRDLRDHNRSFTGILAWHHDWLSLTGGGDAPTRVYGANVSANYFEVLGIKPWIGRFFLPSEESPQGGPRYVVIGYALWQNRYGADPAIVGKSIEINQVFGTIIGVAPEGFIGAMPGIRTDVFLPLAINLGPGSTDWQMQHRENFWLNVTGRLRPGVDRDHATQDLEVLMRQLVTAFPDQHKGVNTISLDPLWRSPFGANVYLYGTLPMLLALAGALMLLACANVANLLLVRSVGRRREMAIRLSMGASRWRVMRQLLVENLLIALAGGAVALTLTVWTAGTMSAFLPPTTLPLTLNGHVDSSVFFATLLVSVFTAVVAGALPALRASQLSPVSVLKDEALSTSGGLSKSRLTGSLVIAQIALSLLLLTCAGLFVRSLQNAQNSTLGFDPNHVLLTTYDLDPVGYTGTTGSEFDRQLLARVKALPGVQSATLADFAPLNFTIHSDFVQPEGYVPRPHESMEVDRGQVGPGYLETLRTPLIASRLPSSSTTGSMSARYSSSRSRRGNSFWRPKSMSLPSSP